MGTFHSCDNYWMDWNFNILYLGTYHCCRRSTRILLGILGANTFSWESWRNHVINCEEMNLCKILGLNVKIKTDLSNILPIILIIVKWEVKVHKSDKYEVWSSRHYLQIDIGICKLNNSEGKQFQSTSAWYCSAHHSLRPQTKNSAALPWVLFIYANGAVIGYSYHLYGCCLLFIHERIIIRGLVNSLALFLHWRQQPQIVINMIV